MDAHIGHGFLQTSLSPWEDNLGWGALCGQNREDKRDGRSGKNYYLATSMPLAGETEGEGTWYCWLGLPHLLGEAQEGRTRDASYSEGCRQLCQRALGSFHPSFHLESCLSSTLSHDGQETAHANLWTQKAWRLLGIIRSSGWLKAAGVCRARHEVGAQGPCGDSHGGCSQELGLIRRLREAQESFGRKALWLDLCQRRSTQAEMRHGSHEGAGKFIQVRGSSERSGPMGRRQEHSGC